MGREMIERVDVGVPDIVADRVEMLGEIFPEAVTEGKVDFEKLRIALGEEVEERAERYSFSWAGKRDCIRLLQMPSRATLIPAPEESINFEDTGNIFIEGDNLEVLKLLYKSYFGRVKMIYIDPPYNTGNDFVYPDDYADPLDTYLRLTGQKDEAGNLLTSNVETGGRYHSSWLSMMYPRMFLARQLLRDDGVIFISIDDNELHNLRMLMNEIFGEENFIANVVWKRTVSRAVSGKGIAVSHDHILCYGRSHRAVVKKLPVTDIDGYRNPDGDPRGVYKLQKLERTLEGARPTMTFAIDTPNGQMTRTWSVNPEKYKELLHDNRIVFSQSGMPYYKQFLSEFEGTLPDTWWDKAGGYNQDASRELKRLFDGVDVFTSPKPSALLKTMLMISSNPDSLVLDFFSGSCTTAQAVLELNREDGGNRRFVMVQLPEPTGNAELPTIAEIGKERIRRVLENVNKKEEGKLNLEERETPEDLGFKVFKLNESNFKPWVGVEDNEPEGYAKQMDMFIDPLIEGWKPEEVIWEVAVKEGYGLSSRIERIPEVETNSVYCVADPDKEQSFFICLDDELNPDTAKPLALRKDTLFICRDTALSDELAANLALQCHLKTI